MLVSIKLLAALQASGYPVVRATAISTRLNRSLSPTSKLAMSSTTGSGADPVKVRTALDEMSAKGEFVRKESAFRNWISKDPTAKFPAENDRYHLYVSYACPWACRTLMMRALKGLEDVISVTVVHPVWQKTRPTEDMHAGWIFGDDASNNKKQAWTNHDGNGGPFPTHFADTEPDPYMGAKNIRELYEAVNDQNGKYTVPVLFDKKQKQIVSNESADIIRMLNTEFNDLAKNPTVDYYPENLHEAIEKVNEWVYPSLNNGVYRCGFAKTQSAYDQAVDELTDAFDKVDQTLQKQRYMAGDVLTEADIRLFVTLVRFDEVYTVYFKTNTRFVARTPAILNYLREIYQMPGIKETVNMEHIKWHYYCSHPVLNHYSIVPKGANFIEQLEQPHDRDELFPQK